MVAHPYHSLLHRNMPCYATPRHASKLSASQPRQQRLRPIVYEHPLYQRAARTPLYPPVYGPSIPARTHVLLCSHHIESLPLPQSCVLTPVPGSTLELYALTSLAAALASFHPLS